MAFTPKKIYSSNTPGQAPSSGTELAQHFNDNFDAVKSDLDEKDKKIVQLEQVVNNKTKYGISGVINLVDNAIAPLSDSCIIVSGKIINYPLTEINLGFINDRPFDLFPDKITSRLNSHIFVDIYSGFSTFTFAANKPKNYNDSAIIYSQMTRNIIDAGRYTVPTNAFSINIKGDSNFILGDVLILDRCLSPSELDIAITKPRSFIADAIYFLAKEYYTTTSATDVISGRVINFKNGGILI